MRVKGRKREKKEKTKFDIEKKRLPKNSSEAVGEMWSKCPLSEPCTGSPVDGETAVWHVRTASTWNKNDKYFMRAFEDGGFITAGL